MTEHMPPPAGHNRPPKSALDYLIEDLSAATKGKEAELRQREGELAKVQITDDESAGRATQLGAVFLGIRDDLKKERTATNKPFAESVGCVNGHYGPLVEAAEAALQRATAAVDAYRDKKQAEVDAARLKAEVDAHAIRTQATALAETEPTRAADLFQEAADLIEAKPTEDVIVRSGYGASASGRKKSDYVIEDFDAALAHFKTNGLVVEALNKAIAAAIRGKQLSIPGVRISTKSKTVIRS